MASYFGASATSRHLIRLGAEPRSAAFAQNPLEIGKDKFTRNVVQNLNKAATQANSKDLRYLVNCGDKIDERLSIFGEAPIHKAVLSDEEEQKTDALAAIIEECHANVNNIDSNGWTPLHHAANIGDYDIDLFEQMDDVHEFMGVNYKARYDKDKQRLSINLNIFLSS